MATLLGSPETKESSTLGRRLLDWYCLERRELPWRHTRDPYAIWVAEVMLQQTRTETVIPYFESFLAKFPTLESLAAAVVDDVLKAWEGLGYYARARNLHSASRLVVNELGGRLPTSYQSLLCLPGVGPYTAAAVASIAFGHDRVALDGNLRRVLCRLFSIDDDPGRPKTQIQLERLARTVLPLGRAGDFNQALMDLGATICTPRSPQCVACPLVDHCQAHAEGIQEELPIGATRSQRPHRDVTAGVIWDADGHLLITRRPLDGMLGGLWEFPGGKRRPGEALPTCLRREIDEELAISIEVGQLLCTIEHSFSHFHMTLYAFDCLWLEGAPVCLGCTDLRWVTPDQLDAYAFPVADQKIITAIRGQTSQ